MPAPGKRIAHLELAQQTAGMDFTFSTILPILGLGALGWLVPVVVMRRMEDSLKALLHTAVFSAAILTVAGAGLFLALYGAGGAPLGAFLSDPARATGHFIGLGLRAALIWGPVLVLTLVGLGQGVERRRGEAMARRDRDRMD